MNLTSDSVPPVFGTSPERRYWTGWILMIALAASMMALSIIYYFGATSDSSQDFDACDTTLREAVLAKRLDKSTNWRAFDIKVKLLSKTTDNEDAALFRVVSNYERKLPLDTTDLKVLSASKKKSYPRFARMYSDRLKNEKDVQRIARTSDSTSFISRLIGIHAREMLGNKTARSELHRDSNALSFVGKFAVGIMALSFMGGLAILGIYVVMRVLGQLEPLGHPLQWISNLGADLCATKGAQVLLVLIGGSLLPLRTMLGDVPKPTVSLIRELLILFGVLLVVRSRVQGSLFSFKELGLDIKKLGTHLLWGVVAAIVNVPVYFCVSMVSKEMTRNITPVKHPILTEITNAPNAMTIIALTLSAVICAPIIEETFFRGYALGAISKVTKSPIWGIVITSACFALFHGTGLPSWLPLASIGAMAALVTYQTKSIVPAMVLHAIHNGSMLIMSFSLSNM